MYGPVDGIGCVDWSFAGVPAGTGAAKIVARMFWKSPCGLFSVIVMSPVASSAVIPEMSPFFVFENWSAPTMFVKKPTPGESTRNRRLIAYLKSLAFTGVPFEYLRPERSVSLYVLPSEEICGMSFASAGTRVAPSGPETCLYPSRLRYTFHIACHPCTVYDRPGSR